MIIYILIENYSDGESCLINTGHATRALANKAAKDAEKEYGGNGVITVSVHEIEIANHPLVQAAMEALESAESWVKDQLEGTRQFEQALADLEPIRKVIRKAGGKV